MAWRDDVEAAAEPHREPLPALQGVERRVDANQEGRLLQITPPGRDVRDDPLHNRRRRRLDALDRGGGCLTEDRQSTATGDARNSWLVSSSPKTAAHVLRSVSMADDWSSALWRSASRRRTTRAPRPPSAKRGDSGPRTEAPPRR